MAIEPLSNIERQVIPANYAGPAIFCSYTRLVETGSLKPNPKNPNRHPRKQVSLLEKIIGGNGWRAPIVVSNLSGMIVKGEGRWTTALQAGWTHVPVDFQDYISDAAELADLTADNEIATLAQMDKKKRHAILEELNTGEIDLEITGIPLAELEEMFNESRKDENKVLYPMAAQLHEKYDYVLIFTSNETDRINLHEMVGVEKEVSYKMNKEVGLGRSVPFEKFIKNITEWRERTTKGGLNEVKQNNIESSESRELMDEDSFPDAEASDLLDGDFGVGIRDDGKVF